MKGALTRLWRRVRPDWLVLPCVLALLIALPPWSLTPFAWIALVPWLWAVERAPSATGAMVTGLWLSLGLGVGTLYPVAHAFADYQDISWLTGALVALLTALVFQLQLPAYAVVRWWLRPYLRRSPLVAVTVAAGLYTGLDWVVPKPFNDTLGMVFYDSGTLRQAADLGGPLVLTFLLVCTHEALAAALRAVRQASPGTLRATLGSAKVLLVPLVLLVTSLIYGGRRERQWSELLANSDAHVRVGIVQGNLPLDLKRAVEKGDDAAADRTLSTYLRLSDELADSRGGPPDLIVWPETTYPGLFRLPFTSRQAQRNARLDMWVQARQQALAFGAYDGSRAADGRLVQYNAVVALSPVEPRAREPALAEAEVYRKNVLVPFGETIPLVGDVEAVRRLFPHVPFFGRGPGPEIVSVRLPGGRSVELGPTVCYEDFFPDYSLAEARLGADLLVNASNDGWFGPYLVRELHLTQAVFRSVETRLPQARAASSGISAIVLPTGEIVARSRALTEATLTASVPLVTAASSPARSIGLRVGPFMLLAGIAGLVGLRWRHGRMSVRSQGTKPASQHGCGR